MYTKEYLIKVIKDLYEQNKEVPTKRMLNLDKNLPSDMAFRKAFGSWGEAIRSAGLEPQKPKPSKLCIENSIKAHKGKVGFNNKGGKRITAHGYVELWKPEHPNANSNGYVLEHRYIMSEFIGRPLKENEDVHHKDRNKQNNHLKNLELMMKSEHTKFHENEDDKHKRKQLKKCNYPNCKNLTSSKYGLCVKHYKIQWQRFRNGLISSLNEYDYKFDGHSEETKAKLSKIAKRQPRKKGKFAKRVGKISTLFYRQHI